MSTTPNAGQVLRNPIIGDNGGDTLFQVECCLSFIARVHEDIADWQSVCNGDGIFDEQERVVRVALAKVEGGAA